MDLTKAVAKELWETEALKEGNDHSTAAIGQ